MRASILPRNQRLIQHLVSLLDAEPPGGYPRPLWIWQTGWAERQMGWARVLPSQIPAE